MIFYDIFHCKHSTFIWNSLLIIKIHTSILSHKHDSNRTCMSNSRRISTVYSQWAAKLTIETGKLDNLIWIVGTWTCSFEGATFQWCDIGTTYRGDHRTGNIRVIVACNIIDTYILWNMGYIWGLYYNCFQKLLELLGGEKQ